MNNTKLNRLGKQLEKHTKNLFEMVYNYDNSKWIKLDNKERIDSFKYQMGLDDKNNRVVRSLTIGNKNDEYITHIQQLAKEKDQFISKDVIVNIAIDYLANHNSYPEDEENYNDWIRRLLR